MKQRAKRPMLIVQMAEEEKETLREAANAEGHLELSVWVRKVLLEKANSILRKVKGPKKA